MKSTLSTADLESLIAALEVEFVKLVECLVSPGWRMNMAATDLPGIHYNIAGMGRLTVGNTLPITLTPHTLVILPPNTTFNIEAAGPEAYGTLGAAESQSFKFPPDAVRRLVAGDRQPEIVLICGYFRASYGTTTDLFSSLPKPIVEMFSAGDQLDETFKTALTELIAQEVGAATMSALLMKRVLITLVRRSLGDAERWSERFAALSDPKVARAFAQLVARPAVPHTVQSLADVAGLSRSMFAARFRAVFGDSPMVVLRQIRMRRARGLLATGTLTVDQVAAAVGYARPSFYRAYRKIYGQDPMTGVVET